MPIPQTISLTSIDLGTRGRTSYNGIEELAESIEHNGLIQPIVLSKDIRLDTMESFYRLVAGGRRLTALRSLGVTDLHHGVTSVPGTYGFVLKGEAGTELSNLLTEIAENLDREDVPWQDAVRMLVRAARLCRQDAHVAGHMIVMRDLGAILGCGYQDLRAAEAVHDDVVANPQDYVNVPSIRGAYQVLLKKQQKHLEAELVSRMANRVQVGPSPVLVPPTDEKFWIEADKIEATPPVVIPLSEKFFNCNGIYRLQFCKEEFDHIICDPDFAVSKERLEAGIVGAAAGLAQDSTEASLVDLEQFIRQAFHALRTKGFLVFFYDLDHHEKVQSWCTAAGFATQRWPVVWHKTDYRSNASPQCNTTKDMEYICLARKAGTVFSKDGPEKSVWSGAGDFAFKEFGHPFAKPRWLWHRIFNLVAIKGQRVFDPFVGSGSSAVAGIEWGLDFSGCEIQEQHYNSLILNCQKEYRKLVGEHAQFA